MVKNKPPAIQRSLSELSSQISNISPSKRILPNDISEPWHIKYAPRTLEEVAIHKKKLQEVHGILESMLKGSACNDNNAPRILLMTGPSGCSKSTVIYKLAERLVPKYRSNGIRIHGSQRTGSNVVEFMEADNFHEFLVEAQYRQGPNLSVVLVEDLPNVFHTDTRHAFQKALLEWLYSTKGGLPPLVICITECSLGSDGTSKGYGIESNFTAESVLNKEILAHPRLARIKFNPINTTLMKKRLKSITQDNRKLFIENSKWNVKDSKIEQLANTTGDIRSAIANLQYWATSAANVSLDAREESLTYFHTIGKILHGSRECSDDNEMINALIFDSKSHVVDDNVRLGLLENYSLVNGGQLPLSKVCEIVDSLSESDSMGNSLECVEFALRKVRNQLGSVTKNRPSQKAIFPREWKMRQLQLEFQVDCDDYANVDFYKYYQIRTTRNLRLYLSHYGPLIRSRRNYKRNSLSHYIIENEGRKLERINTNENPDILQLDPTIDCLERIGGAIKSLGRQEEIVTNDDNESLTKNSIHKLKQRKDQKLLQLLKLHTQNQAEQTETFDEPIVDSEAEDDGNTSVYHLPSQRHPDINESLSDSDLEDL